MRNFASMPLGSQPATKPRVAVLGFVMESNASARTSGRAHFEAGQVLDADALGRILDEGVALSFAQEMKKFRDVEVVPIGFFLPEAGGPVEDAFFESAVGGLISTLERAGPVDGLFAFLHGSAQTETIGDADGEILERVRAALGPGAGVVTLLDYHANVSSRVVELSDLVIGFRRDPHTDVDDRVRECAARMADLLAGWRPEVAWAKVPVLVPSLCATTEAGSLFRDLIDIAEHRIGRGVRAASVLAGYLPGDSADAGVTVLAAGDDGKAARSLVAELACKIWDARTRFQARLMPIGEAVERAVAAGTDPSLPRVVLADVSDNPGAGAPGTTTALLASLLAAPVKKAFLGLFIDAGAAAQAHSGGVGARLRLVLNRDRADELSARLELDAEVLALTSSPFINTRGVAAGSQIHLGRAALLKVRGLSLAVCERPQQIYSSDFIAHFGFEPEGFRTFILKSRGHYRAGFDHLVDPENMLPVDAPGLNAQSVDHVAWRNVRRPIYPLDVMARWSPTVRFRMRQPPVRR